MQEQIHKEIDLAKEKLSSDDIERHSFNVEGLKLLAGFSISRHWDIVVSRACKRDMLRRMLCRKDGEAVRWSFVEDLEQILEMNVTSAVPERINISSMKKEFVDLLTPSRTRKAHYNRTYVGESFVKTVIGAEAHRSDQFYELEPNEIVISRCELANTKLCLLECSCYLGVSPMTDRDSCAEFCVVIYREKSEISVPGVRYYSSAYCSSAKRETFNHGFIFQSCHRDTFSYRTITTIK